MNVSLYSYGVTSLGYLQIFGFACVQLAHSILGDWKEKSVAHLIIIIKPEVSTIPIAAILVRGCVSEVVVL